jgi:hypothetical protein
VLEQRLDQVGAAINVDDGTSLLFELPDFLRNLTALQAIDAVWRGVSN